MALRAGLDWIWGRNCLLWGDSGKGFPEKIWVPHLWNCSRQSLSQNKMVFNVLSNTNHFVVTKRPVTPGILQPSLLGPDLSSDSTSDLEEAQECTLIKLAGNASLGATSSYWNLPESRAGIQRDQEPSGILQGPMQGVAPGMEEPFHQSRLAPTAEKNRWVMAKHQPVVYSWTSWVLQWFILSIHCCWDIWLWNLNNMVSAVLLQNKPW